jgi:two-component system response regulator YesN
MYKIFLVEDEIIVREAIRDNIDWESHGFVFAGEAPDGELALPLIEEIKPDILITDIKMPFVNGLELSKIVKKNMPWIKIVILSGHDEFEYTKEAISINVNEYLLKPITSKDLINALNKVVEQIEDEKRQKENYHLISNRLKDSMQMMKEKFLSDLATGVLPYTEAIEKADNFGLDIIARFYAAVLIKLEYNRDRSSYEDYSEYLKAEEIINDIVDKNDDVLKYKVNLKSMVLIVKNDNAEELESYCFLLAQSIKSEVERNTCCTIAASIGSIRERIQGIASSLKDAEIAMSFSYIFGKDEIIGIQDTKFSKMISKDLFSLDEATTIDYLRFKDEKYILAKLTSLIENIKDQELNLFFFTQVIMNVTIAVTKFIEELGEKVENILPELEDVEGIIDCIYTIDGLLCFVRKLISRAIQLRENKRNNRYGEIIWKAKKFIDENYSDSSLSLNMVAEYVNMSPSHFSTIFSQELNMTFIEYLTSVRISKAKEKLRTTNLKSSEIAYRVGYNDPHYFSHVFKKETGFRPTDYRSSYTVKSEII